MLEKITTVRHIHRKYGNKITDRSICFDQHVSGLVKVGGGGGGTYIYILTYRIKNDIRINLFIRINKFRWTREFVVDVETIIWQVAKVLKI